MTVLLGGNIGVSDVTFHLSLNFQVFCVRYSGHHFGIQRFMKYSKRFVVLATVNKDITVFSAATTCSLTLVGPCIIFAIYICIYIPTRYTM